MQRQNTKPLLVPVNDWNRRICSYTLLESLDGEINLQMFYCRILFVNFLEFIADFFLLIIISWEFYGSDFASE